MESLVDDGSDKNEDMEKDDQDEGNPERLNMVLQDIIFNTQEQIAEVQSMCCSANTECYSQQMETRPI